VREQDIQRQILDYLEARGIEAWKNHIDRRRYLAIMEAAHRESELQHMIEQRVDVTEIGVGESEGTLGKSDAADGGLF
jgi:tRNA(His) 5'-end guanylyltransferase